jgi:hypothetical protein
MSALLILLARLRVPLGFLCGAIALALARPTPASLAIGAGIAAIGEAVRVWASGHIDKGREVTRTGPYRFVRHPLYVGSAIMGAGFVAAARSLTVALLVSIYLLLTTLAAIRTEETALDARFGGEYSAYRAGQAAPVARAFSLARVGSNREYRAIVGLVVGMGLLYWRSRM